MITGTMLFLQPIIVALCVCWTIEGVHDGRPLELIWLIPALIIGSLWVATYRTHMDTVRIRGRIEQLDKCIAEERTERLKLFQPEEWRS